MMKYSEEVVSQKGGSTFKAGVRQDKTKQSGTGSEKEI